MRRGLLLECVANVADVQCEKTKVYFVANPVILVSGCTLAKGAHARELAQGAGPRSTVPSASYLPSPLALLAIDPQDRDASCKAEVLLVFPESLVRDCFNHLVKTFFKSLQGVKTAKCTCSSRLPGAPPHRRMADGTLLRIKNVMKNLIIGHEGTASELADFFLNIINHYCLDDHRKCEYCPKVDKSGNPYHTKGLITCEAQVAALLKLLKSVGRDAQAYMDARGFTTNLCEGFHRIVRTTCHPVAPSAPRLALQPLDPLLPRICGVPFLLRSS